MSAIVGAYHYDGDPVDREVFHGMLDRLAHRGPDGAGDWHGDEIALGALKFWTTPEDVGTAQPLVNDRFVVAANARLDNREELCALLEVPADAPDVRLILRAFERWGTSCPEHLLGGFVFAIWDRTERSLFCARDHFGVRPLYFADLRARRVFLFASEIKALFEHPALERKINEVRLLDYLTEKTKADREITIFENVRRLEPGHVLIVDRDGARTRAYWSLEPQDTIRYGSDDEYAEHFADILRESVRCRMRSSQPAGSELSGGLDSSFVSCIARDLSAGEDWHTISNVFDRFEECDEREYMDHVLAGGGIQSHRTVSDDIGPLSLLSDIYRAIDDPYTGGNHHMVWRCYQTARENGVRVLLDGFDGDTVIGHGPEILRKLAEEGQWTTYWEELQAAARNLAGTPHRQTLQVELSNPQQMLQHHVDVILEKHLSRLNYVGFVRTVTALRRELSVNHRRLYRRYLRRLVTAPFDPRARRMTVGAAPPADFSFLTPEFLNRPAVKERIEFHRTEQPPLEHERSGQFLVLRSDIFPRSMEIMDHYAAANGIEVRHPYMDKRLVEYCLALPLSLSFRNGWSRWVMRLAMRDIVPEEIRWRSGKANLAPAFDHGLFVLDKDLLETSVDNPGDLARFVDAGHMRRLYDERDSLDGKGIWQLAFLAALSIWWNRRR